MPITLNGSGTVSGISAGGLPDGIIQSADLASGVGGKILQVQYAVKTDTASNSLATQTWWSVYNAGFQVTLTPSSASNKILLIAQIMYSEGSGQWYQFRFEKNGAFDSAFAGAALFRRNRRGRPVGQCPHLPEEYKNGPGQSGI